MAIRIPAFVTRHGSSHASSTTSLSLIYLITTIAHREISPFRHSLFVGSIAWSSIWLFCTWRCRTWSGDLVQSKRNAARAAGILLALSSICERVSCDDEGVAAFESLLPFLTQIMEWCSLRILTNIWNPDINDSVSESSKLTANHWRYLGTVTISALAACHGIYVTPQVTVLALVSVSTKAIALVILKALGDRPRDRMALKVMDHSPNESSEVTLDESRHYYERSGLYKLTATAATLGNALGGFYIEQNPLLDLNSGSLPGHELPILGAARVALQATATLLTSATSLYFLMLLASERSATSAAIASLCSNLVRQVWMMPRTWTVWLLMLYLFSASALWTLNGISSDVDGAAFLKGTSPWLSTALLALAVVSLLLQITPISGVLHRNAFTQSPGYSSYSGFDEAQEAPLAMADRARHPIDVLSKDARAAFNATLSSQSQTIHEAVEHYRKRYGVYPPPKFDRWFEFAKQKGTLLLDEFDNIHDTLLPFWSLRPSVLRERVSEAIGYDDNGLMAVMIRNGRITLIDGSQEWLRDALVEMTAGFIEYIPDMDIAFNIHDEPRVIVPHSELSQMVTIAKDQSMPSVSTKESLRNAFSSRTSDMTDGTNYREYTTTRFNKFSHQPTWSHARLSCPPDSPARDFSEQSPDNSSVYSLGESGFIKNHTAFSDICNSPSLRHSYGLFDRPNMFIPTQDLVPVFSQSKLSSFQDILYPSPWYWANKVQYRESDDKSWEDKNDTLHWRGSTTGGYSRRGGWRRHHRQRCVQNINARNTTYVLERHAGHDDSPAEWKARKVERANYLDLIDVKFSSVGQCDEGDCHAQTEFFHVVEHEEQQSVWNFKHLLDMDGNAFSGRFVAFLRSNSLVYKMALFREWHSDWIQPWLHYVPLSLRGDEWLEAVRYFAEEPEGKELAKYMAQTSRDWVDRALRKEDMEVWFFRLLLEYGRLLDDDRENIGYSGP